MNLIFPLAWMNMLLAAAILGLASGKPLLFSSEANHSITFTYFKLRHSLASVKNLPEAALKNERQGQDTVLQSVIRDGTKYGARNLNKLQHLSLKNISCDACKALTVFLHFAFESHWSETAVEDGAYRICLVFIPNMDHRTCRGIVNLFKDEVLTVFDNLVLEPQEVCGYLVGSSCGSPYYPLQDWNVTLPDIPKPPVFPHILPKPGSPTLRVLHLTDIHLDMLYAPDTNPVCKEPLCCRADDGKPAPGVSGAGRYGDYRNCDTPIWTLEGLFKHLAGKQFDYILWTGDLPAHNIWNQSRSDQTGLLRNLTVLMQKYFPNKPVFPCVGNHESSPVNSFPPLNIKGNNSITWLYDAMAEAWKFWLPKDALESVRHGGFYTVSPYPGFRIISINTNVCNNNNWWLLLNTTDPDGQLAWLIQTLQQAETKKEKVHIIGHIPPGIPDCLAAWSRNYYKIVNRYESTIVNQFFGHTHNDHFEVFYDEETHQRPTNVAFVSPSVTPFSQLNMGYRLFTMDGNYSHSSWAVLDHETFILNLTQANAAATPPVWQLEYSAKAAYGMKSLFPQDWSDLVSRMEKNDTLFHTFNQYFYKSHPTQPCTGTCKQYKLCCLRSGTDDIPHLCPELPPQALFHLVC